MPELPEVETIRRSLLPLVQGAEIETVQVFLAKAVRPAPAEFAAGLTGRRITGIERRGKYLLFQLDNGQCLAIHLRMAGRLVWQSRTALGEAYYVGDKFSGREEPTFCRPA